MRQTVKNDKPNNAEASGSERFLSLLVDGAALGVPQVDETAYKAFRANLSKQSLQLPDRLPEEEKLAQIRAVLQEFENYRKSTEEVLRERLAGWRSLVTLLFNEVLHSLGIDCVSCRPAELLRAIATATSEQSLQDLRERLEAYLHPAGTSSSPVEASQLKKSDFSTANDNAAGLRGGGSAIEDLKKLMEKNNQGSVVIFRLSCLNMISQRFGPEAVEDCLMAVAAFLTERLHADDTIYHWSDSSLLAILQGRPNEQILNSELERISMQNRETTVSIGGHCTMLRIPLTFDVTPIERLKSSEDLNKISLLSYGGSAR